MVRTWIAEFDWVCRHYPSGKYIYVLHKLGRSESLILGMRGMGTWRDDLQNIHRRQLMRAYRNGLKTERGAVK